MGGDARQDRVKRNGHGRELLERCYRFAYLEGRRDCGMTPDDREQREGALLRREMQGLGRRRHRRFHVSMTAQIKCREGVRPGEVLDLSGGGMFVALGGDLPPDDRVQVRLGDRDGTDYLFTCLVVRRAVDEEGRPLGVGLAFCCVPLELRRAA